MSTEQCSQSCSRALKLQDQSKDILKEAESLLNEITDEASRKDSEDSINKTKLLSSEPVKLKPAAKDNRAELLKST